MNNQSYPFVYYLNDNYLIPTFLSCYSLIKHYKNGVPIEIIFEHNKLSQKSVDKLKSLETFWGSQKDVHISFFDVSTLSVDIDIMQKNLNESQRNNLTWGLTPETFFRFWISEITSAPYAFSIDSDTIIVDDLSNVWDFE